MKRKTWIGVLIGVVVVLVAGGAGFWWHQEHAASPNTIGKTATIYLNGYGATAHSADYLVGQGEKAGGQKVLTATVARDGAVSWRGSAAHAVHPLVPVVFANSRPHSLDQAATWLRSVVHQLKARYGVQRINVVAHSLGNLVYMTYAEKWGTDADVPRSNAYVAIAGHYDGILGMDDKPHRIKLASNGYPTPQNRSFKPLAAARKQLPKYLKILNIYGDRQDGKDSDGRVANNSSRSLRYLVAPSKASYQEKQINGKKAQHSALRENPQVAKAVDSFLNF